jgi:hypothetical protein
MKDAEFAYRIRQALNEGTDRLDYKTAFRLEQARKAALALQRAAGPESAWVPLASPQLVAAGAGWIGSGAPSRPGLWRWLRGAGMVVPLLALVLGFIGVHQWQESEAIAESAALDFAVLLDEFPIDTYAEKGFGALLNHESVQSAGP